MLWSPLIIRGDQNDDRVIISLCLHLCLRHRQMMMGISGDPRLCRCLELISKECNIWNYIREGGWADRTNDSTQSLLCLYFLSLPYWIEKDYSNPTLFFPHSHWLLPDSTTHLYIWRNVQNPIGLQIRKLLEAPWWKSHGHWGIVQILHRSIKGQDCTSFSRYVR